MNTTPLLQGPAVSATLAVPQCKLENLVCLVLDCVDVGKGLRVCRISDPKLKFESIAEVDLYEGTWMFKLDREAPPMAKDFWSYDPRFSSGEFESIFQTRFDHERHVRVGSEPTRHRILIGRGVVSKRLMELLRELGAESAVAHYSLIGVYDMTNLEHISQIAADSAGSAD